MRGGQTDLQKNRKRQLDTQHHLRDDQTLKRIADKENQQQCNAQRQDNPYLRVAILNVV